MLTREASPCTGRGERLGRIEPGALGDLLLLDSQSHSFTPLNDPVRQLIYGGGPGEIRAVIVAGEVVVRDGGPTRVDETQMLARAREAAASETSPGGDGAVELERLIEGLYRRAEEASLDVDAYLPS